MNESLSSNPDAKFTTKLGSTYTARYLEENGNIVWATPKEGAAELVSKYGDKYKVKVKGNKIILSDGVDEWTIS